MVTLLTRRKVDTVSEDYHVNITEEEEQGRLKQHVQGGCGRFVIGK